jgi:hypothetical protein
MDGQMHGNLPLPTREWLTGRVMVLLSHFYTQETDPAVVRAQAGDWFDTLWDVPQEAIEGACRDYLRNGPRRRPSPGDIRNLATIRLPKQPRRNADDMLLEAPPLEPGDPAKAAAILERAGFTPQRMDAIRQAPMATTFAAAQERVEKPAALHWSEKAAPDDPTWEVLRQSRIKAGMIAE